MVIAALVFSAAGCGGEGSDETVYRTVRKDSGTRPAGSSPVMARAETDPDTAGAVSGGQAAGEIEAEEGFGEVTYEGAEAAYLDRDYRKAVDMFTVYTGERAENPWGFYMLGLSAWKAGDYEKAEGAFRMALDLDPDHLKSHINLARVFLDSGSPESAAACVDEALAIEPGSAVAYRLRGRALHQLGERDGAIEAYRNALMIDDHDAWSMNNMALIMIEQERFEEALSPLARAVEIKGGVALFHNNLGMALERCGYYRAAEKAYDTALTLEFYERPEINFERISQVDEEPGLEPVDLAALSSGFAGQVESWKAAYAGSAQPDSTVATAPVPSGDPAAGNGRQAVAGSDSAYAGREKF